MASFGFSKAIIAVYDENEKVTHKWDIDQKVGSTVEASISNIAPQGSPIYGSDSIWKNPTKGVGAVQVSFTANAIPKDILDIILGKKGTDGFGHINKDTQPPQCSLEMIAEDGESGKTSHMAIVNGTFSLGSVDLKTNTASQVHSPDKLTFKAETRKSDGELYVDVVENDKFDAEKWEEFVRPTANNVSTASDNATSIQ
ncbi:major tail protein [Lactococcus garvieae]|uniref:Phage major tail protein, phi13 family n=1 Tax=Lactococcus garvieae TaxID=1363 RepID=A0A1I4I4T4_9LACT|nr:major tail protein [Lactococcus garvieae]SFL49274.1 phage major tail protein, phi13 family [Lactococcus garvieae]